MLALTNYLFYCFFCLVSAKNFDRVGAARAGLFLFFVFAIVDVYTLLVGVLGVKSHFIGVVIGAGFFARLALVRYYFQPRLYADVLVRYEQTGEPHRVRYALTGLSLLLICIFVPFLILKIAR